MTAILLSLMLSASSVPPDAAKSRAWLVQQGVSMQDSVRATAFLALLATAWTPLAEQGGYDPRRAGPWEVSKLVSFLASGGVTFFDVNGDTTWKVDSHALRQQLDQRRGPAFDMLLHLGYIYDLRRPQYAALSFAYDRGLLITNVGTSAWYRLTFLREGGSLRISQVEYLEYEGE